ncbi:prokineticin receptor 2 [Nematostella vectensis]|uniref:prokineticin receptor 2 n=1 Tax=Nematostella vectensis TaxID=45351 RepID=UPI0020776917|nr:prokineticin receptor 2 [Nematostella vectensis]
METWNMSYAPLPYLNVSKPPWVESSRAGCNEFFFSISHEVKVSLTAPAVFTSFLSSVANVLIIYVTSRPGMRNSTNILILNMAISDVISTLVGCPITTKSFWTNTWFKGLLGEITCRSFYTIFYSSCYVSLFSLLFISLDRLFAVKRPLKHKALSGWVKYAVAVTWISALLSLDTVFSACLGVTSKGEVFCGQRSSKLNGFILGTVFLGMLIAMIAIYAWIGHTLRTRRTPGEQRVMMKQRNAQTASRATRMIIATLAAFVICWSPSTAEQFTAAVFSPEVSLCLSTFAYTILYSNGFLNLCIYVAMNGKFRKEFKGLLGFRSTGNPQGVCKIAHSTGGNGIELICVSSLQGKGRQERDVGQESENRTEK